MWFPPADIPLENGELAKPPVIVGLSGYSRVMVAEMIPSARGPRHLVGNLACLQALGAVPKKGVYDNEGALVSRRGGKATLSEPFERFRGTLGMGSSCFGPADPESKGMVEPTTAISRQLLPGRRFSSPADFNEQLDEWLERANRRVHGTLRCRPIDRFEEDKAAMMTLPPVLPDTALRLSTRLARDHWVSGRDLRLLGAPQGDRPDGRGPGHSRRGGRHLRERGGRSSSPFVGQAPHRHRSRTRCRPRPHAATRLRRETTPLGDEVEIRDLSVYDRATGVA